ncbi:MAG TPA: NAD(P)-binding domain-containing protein [Thermoplasmata archaeon]|nr:NAD(P)-binding domain-containing protein [Thermoplasmata archaeon]
MKIGILGSGDVGRALGSGFVGTGHAVKIGAREAGRPSLVAWAAATGGAGATGTFAEAADFGELLVLAVHGVAVEDAIRATGPHRFDGKIVIDATNPLVLASEAPPRLARGFTTSNGEIVQSLLPRARVVKAFNIVGNPSFYRPTFPGGPPDMWICGDDAAAKATVTELLSSFGWPSVVDLGGIASSRELESLCVLWVKTALALGTFDIAFKVLRK